MMQQCAFLEILIWIKDLKALSRAHWADLYRRIMSGSSFALGLGKILATFCMSETEV
jgi:hypothetical protein